MTEHRGFLTVGQMAGYLGCSEKTVRRRLAVGLIRRAPLGNRLIRIPASELDRLSGDIADTDSSEIHEEFEEPADL